MLTCKYCGKPIEKNELYNPDKDGNGYHHSCLIEMEFESRDRQLYNKGKKDVLKQIRTEIDQLPTYLEYPNIEYITIKKQDLINIIDKALEEQNT